MESSEELVLRRNSPVQNLKLSDTTTKNMPLDISQTKTRTLVFGAVFAAATVLSGNFAAAGAAGLVIQAIGGIAGNIGASDLGEVIKCFRQNQKILEAC